MFEQQHFIDSQGNSTFGGRDSKSWLTGEDNSSPSERREQPLLGNSGTVNGNVDRLLFNDLVEIVPLVQSLIVSGKWIIVIFLFEVFKDEFVKEREIFAFWL